MVSDDVELPNQDFRLISRLRRAFGDFRRSRLPDRNLTSFMLFATVVKSFPSPRIEAIAPILQIAFSVFPRGCLDLDVFGDDTGLLPAVLADLRS